MFVSITQAAAQLRVGQLTASQLLESCWTQIAARESTVQAWVCLAEEEARRAARRLDELAQSGTFAGPLHGIPIGIKDIIDVAGLPTLCGSRLRAETTERFVASNDAPVVKRLRDAGAIILGKTVTTEFACFDPPPTRNPRNLDRTPGGSSSGSAAAVASGMCLGAIGSQTGGSIVRPASFCGVAGFKPTKDRVSTRQVFPISGHLDHVGPMARSAADLQLLFAAIQERVAFRSDAARAAAERTPPLDVHSLYVIEDFFFTQAQPQVREVTRAAIDRLRATGIAIHTLTLPASFGELHRMHKRLMARDAATVHQADFARRRDAFGPCIASLIDEGLAITPAEYDEALQHQQRFQNELLAAWPTGAIAVTPATVTTAPTRDSTGDPRFNSPWSYTGFPSVTIPCGDAADGLPCGLQMISPPNTDEALLAAAARLEALGSLAGTR